MYGQQKVGPSEVILTDINASMLEVAKERAAKLEYLDETADPKLTLMEVNAQAIPLENDSVDCVTIAFGIRNCTDIAAVLAEAHRVLRVGGRFMCTSSPSLRHRCSLMQCCAGLEFSHVPYAGLREAYDAYSFYVIPTMGQVVVSHARAVLRSV